jgi:hypothetical protein
VSVVVVAGWGWVGVGWVCERGGAMAGCVREGGGEEIGCGSGLAGWVLGAAE